MAVVTINDVIVLNNPALFTSPYKFEIFFEASSELSEDLEWKIIYVGSPYSEKYDQVLDCILVGPVPVGLNTFIFEAKAPDPKLIPNEYIVGVTVVLLICSYKGQTFVRVGYYVNHSYSENPELAENPPSVPDYEKIHRNIQADIPFVTKFPIEWDD